MKKVFSYLSVALWMLTIMWGAYKAFNYNIDVTMSDVVLFYALGAINFVSIFFLTREVKR
ncbi:hypothetical protein [Halobacillus faecis]|uniref:Uncharacterized protein n=1 Tax=Halobacillus faecis TaxID=360184 RepID=A0A511WYG9_9BACI|nr:hypothetical protein [Halobacillus faecis]GEN55511.1 hypothetical protein HFA01_37730 [Halobacillus faecis]